MNRRRTLLAASAAATIAVVGVGSWWFGGSAPDEVDLDQAVAGLAAVDEPEGGQDAGETDAPGPDGGDAADDGVGDVADAADGADDGAADEAADDRDTAPLAGTWAIDTEVSGFDVDDTGGTFVGFRVDEELSNVGATTAIGRTPEVLGTVTLEGTSITDASFEADLTALVSDRPQRDNRVQGALDTASHPTTTLTLSEPIDLGTEPIAGETIEAAATAELTVSGTSREVQVPIEAVVVDGVLVITGAFDILLSDYGVTAPSAPIVVSVSDAATIELQLFLTRS